MDAFHEAKFKLMDEIFRYTLSYEQAIERYKELKKLIPRGVYYPPLAFEALDDLIEKTYGGMNKTSSIMENSQSNELIKSCSIDFAEWLWRNAIHYQRGGTYTFRETDGNVNTYYIEELYDKYLSESTQIKD